MKTKSLLTVILFFISIQTFSQASKHQLSSGKITFDISYPDSKLDEETLANLPVEAIMKFKDDLIRVEVSMAMGKTTIISNNKTGNGTMLMDMMGNKIAMEMNKEDMMKDKGNSPKPKVELTRESKDIAGYSCKKAIVTVGTSDGDKSFDAWFTNDLKVRNSFSSQIEGIDGFLMEFQTVQNGMSMKMKANHVDPLAIDDSEFIIPDGYKKLSKEDLKKMTGQ